MKSRPGFITRSLLDKHILKKDDTLRTFVLKGRREVDLPYFCRSSCRSLSSITMKRQPMYKNLLIWKNTNSVFRVNFFNSKKSQSQSQYNFTSCRPNFLAKEIKKGEQSLYNEIPPPPPKERSYIYPIFLLSCVSAGIYVLMTEDKEDIQEEILEAVKSKAEEITYNNQMEQLVQMQTNSDSDSKTKICKDDETKEASSRQSDFYGGGTANNVIDQFDDSDILPNKQRRNGWYPGKYISEYLTRK